MKIIMDKGALVLKGNLVVSEIDTIHTQIETMLDELPTDLVLNLSEVDEIDTSGMQLLFALKKSIEEKERGSLQIKSASVSVKEAMSLSGFDAVLKEDLG
jgi:anti-anti-sigma factor